MESKTCYVANGEQAIVKEVTESYIVAELKNPTRTVRIPIGKQVNVEDEEQQVSGCLWELAYAISTHKSQGSEWPIVITMLDDYAGARMVCSREWIYTAISRAKSLQYLVGRKETADAMCRRPAIWKRKTFLRERILLERARMELAEL